MKNDKYAIEKCDTNYTLIEFRTNFKFGPGLSMSILELVESSWT